ASAFTPAPPRRTGRARRAPAPLSLCPVAIHGVPGRLFSRVMPRRLITAIVVLGLTAAAIFTAAQHRTRSGPARDGKAGSEAGEQSMFAAGAGPTWHAADGALEDWLTELASSLAAAPFESDVRPLPRELLDLDYEGLRAIRFREDASLWRGEGRFELQ